MQRYFIDSCSEKVEVEKSSDIYFHQTKVLRTKQGNCVELCDLNGNCYEYEVSSISSTNIMFNKTSEALSSNEVDSRVILAVSLLKNNNFELVLQKIVEIGVTDIIAFESSRTIVKASNFNKKKLDRFKKIILEASEQSKRNVVPTFNLVSSFSKLLETECMNKFVAYEKCDVNGSNLLMNKLSSLSGDIMLVIGSEGGFSEEEIIQFKDKDFETVSLGRRILRAETAAISGATLILAELDNKREEKQ